MRYYQEADFVWKNGIYHRIAESCVGRLVLAFLATMIATGRLFSQSEISIKEQARSKESMPSFGKASFIDSGRKIAIPGCEELCLLDAVTLERQKQCLVAKQVNSVGHKLLKPDGSPFATYWLSTQRGNQILLCEDLLTDPVRLHVGDGVTDVVANLSGDMIYLARQDGTVESRSSGNEILKTWRVAKPPAFDGFLPSRLLLNIGMDDRRLYVIDSLMNTLHVLDTVARVPQRSIALKMKPNEGGLRNSFSADGNTMLIYNNHRAEVIDLRTLKSNYALETSGLISAAAVSSDGKLMCLAFGTWRLGFGDSPKDGTVEVHDVLSKKTLCSTSMLSRHRPLDWLLFHPRKSDLYLKDGRTVVRYSIEGMK